MPINSFEILNFIYMYKLQAVNQLIQKKIPLMQDFFFGNNSVAVHEEISLH